MIVAKFVILRNKAKVEHVTPSKATRNAKSFSVWTLAGLLFGHCLLSPLGWWTLRPEISVETVVDLRRLDKERSKTARGRSCRLTIRRNRRKLGRTSCLRNYCCQVCGQDLLCVSHSTTEILFSVQSVIELYTPTDLVRNGCLSSRKYTGKGPILQYHGVGWHHDQWPQRLHVVHGLWRANDNFLMFVYSVALSVINLFLWTTTQHVIEHSQFDSEGIQRLVWPTRSLDLNPIENVWDALGRQVAGRNYPPKTRTPSSVHSQRNGINCLNGCWIMLCKVWYDV
ncbi:hypothetical protein TNCV_4916811 [Trichonephila clavipes]|nr:hypothetical protein TNCV_4916811 [Trichonephila clavipes]